MPHIPHDFDDPELLELALTHASVGPDNNERLEFLGDAVLDLIVAEILFRERGDLSEGGLTQAKSSVVSRRALAGVAHTMRLERGVTLGRGHTGGASSQAMLANLYEAVLGAVYLDAGFEAARRFAAATLKEPLDEALRRSTPSNPKQALQHYAQAHVGTPPMYEVVEERGRDHAKAFLIRAVVGAREFPSAWGRSRREAERWAAFEATLALESESTRD